LTNRHPAQRGEVFNSFVNILPKTRSGKIMRRVLKRVWTGEAVGDVSTIEDEASIEEVKEAVSRMKILRG
jgi:acetyl-CoA synthetase